jgi:hypothetical protein
LRDVSCPGEVFDFFVLLVKVFDLVPDGGNSVLVCLQLLLETDDLLPVVDLLLFNMLVLRRGKTSFVLLVFITCRSRLLKFFRLLINSVESAAHFSMKILRAKKNYLKFDDPFERLSERDWPVVAIVEVERVRKI